MLKACEYCGHLADCGGVCPVDELPETATFEECEAVCEAHGETLKH